MNGLARRADSRDAPVRSGVRRPIRRVSLGVVDPARRHHHADLALELAVVTQPLVLHVEDGHARAGRDRIDEAHELLLLEAAALLAAPAVDLVVLRGPLDDATEHGA